MTEPGDFEPEPPQLRGLRLMVSALTAVLILGMIVVAGALALRLTRDAPGFDPGALRAERISLPEGERIIALGGAGGALMVATRDAQGTERLRLFDPESGAARRVVEIGRQGAERSRRNDPAGR